MRFIKILKLNLLLILLCNNVYAKTDYFNEGFDLFQKKNYDKAKFKFEQDLVFYPKNEKSYLYLSKIFNIQKKIKLEETNLESVILLNPKNEEALYSLAKLRLKESDYIESSKLIERLLPFCKNYCEKSKKLKREIDSSTKK